MTLIRRLIERVRRCAAPRPLLVCTDGLVSYIRAIRETFRDPAPTGKGGRPRLRPWRHVLIAQVVKRYERRRVVETTRRIVDGTPARVETLRRIFPPSLSRIFSKLIHIIDDSVAMGLNRLPTSSHHPEGW